MKSLFFNGEKILDKMRRSAYQSAAKQSPYRRCLVRVSLFCAATVLLLVSSAFAQRISATWKGQSLGTVLARLAETQSECLWLDRRVDIGQTVDAKFREIPFQQVLEEIARGHGLGVARVGPCWYVGPEAAAQILPKLRKRARDSLNKIPAAQRQRWLRMETVAWPRLSQPRALLEEMLAKAGIALEQKELIAHDLWSANQLPPLALLDRVVLLLVGFDLTCEISDDGRLCRIVPIDHSLEWSRNNPLRSKRKKRTTRSTPNRTGALAEKRFSLQIENQAVGTVLQQLAEQLDLQLVWDETSLNAAELSRKTLVSCQVTKASLDELLRSIVEPAGMKFTRKGVDVEVHARR